MRLAAFEQRAQQGRLALHAYQVALQAYYAGQASVAQVQEALDDYEAARRRPSPPADRAAPCTGATW